MREPVRASELDFGIYVHIPFCQARCYYCDFVVKPLQEGAVRSYLDSLGREVAWQAEKTVGRHAVSLYLGGGTPSALSARQLSDLLALLQRSFRLADDAEVSLEANPGTLDREKLLALRAAGVNRLSLGLQAWQDAHLEKLGRLHRRRDFLEGFQAARAVGFDNLNVDLIFGLPGQTLDEWEETLEGVLSVEPEHISAYWLQVETGTAFQRWYDAGRLDLPAEEAELAMQSLLRERLTAAGFEHYEISNFARPGRASRHNLLYWRNQDYLGLGLGAHSHEGGRRWANLPTLKLYNKRIGNGRLPVDDESVEEPEADREMNDTMMVGLRLLRGVDRHDFQRRFGVDPVDRYGAEIKGLAEAGLLAVEQGRLRLTPKALPVANRVFAAFV